MPWMLTFIAYLMGSVCFGIVIAANHGVDLRATGSGNIGATNVGRVLGKKCGRLVLVLDATKGLLAALGATLWLGRDDPWAAATGLAVVVGHCYPIWYGLKGGKGAATTVGVLLAVVPAAGVTAAVLYIILKKLTRRASVGSLTGAVGGWAVAALLEGFASPPGLMAAAITGLLVWRHRDNLVRLARGEEPAS